MDPWELFNKLTGGKQTSPAPTPAPNERPYIRPFAQGYVPPMAQHDPDLAREWNDSAQKWTMNALKLQDRSALPEEELTGWANPNGYGRLHTLQVYPWQQKSVQNQYNKSQTIPYPGVGGNDWRLYIYTPNEWEKAKMYPEESDYRRNFAEFETHKGWL